MIKAVLFVLSAIGLILILQNVMTEFCSCDFAVWEAPASLKLCIEVILCTELKQGYCKILESVPAVFVKLSWNFHLSLSGCSALAGNRQYITGLSTYYRDMTCFDGLYRKNRVLLAALWDKISIFHLGQTEHLSAQWHCNEREQVHDDGIEMTIIAWWVSSI